MTKEGIVSRVENGFATVLVKTHNACDACRAECGGHCDKAKLEKVTVENTLGAKLGDRVVLYSDTKTVMLWALLVFVVPIIISFAAVLLAYSRTSSPLALTVVGVAAFIGFFAVLRLAFKNKKESDVFQMTEIVKGDKNENY